MKLVLHEDHRQATAPLAWGLPSFQGEEAGEGLYLLHQELHTVVQAKNSSFFRPLLLNHHIFYSIIVITWLLVCMDHWGFVNVGDA